MIELRRSLTVLAVGAGLALASTGFSAAQAARVTAGESTGLSCTAGSVSLFGSGYTSCAGAFAGNDTGNQGTLLDKLNSGSIFSGEYDAVSGASWEILGKSDDGSNDVTAENGSTLGSWSAMLDNVYSTIAVSLKSSTSYSTYLFTGVTTAELSGLFDTVGTSINQRGNAQALSHMTVAYYNAPTPEEPEAESVPEPGMVMGLLAMTTVGIGSLKSRRRDRC